MDLLNILCRDGIFLKLTNTTNTAPLMGETFCFHCDNILFTFLMNHVDVDFVAHYILCFYFSRNNGYAISTPTKDQYRGDGIGKPTKLYITYACI